jgi:hypothetical protein
MCEVIHYSIAYKITDENRFKDKEPIYDIKNIKYLLEDITNNLINTINYVKFYFKVYEYRAALVYIVQQKDDSYEFAPCYNYAMRSEVREKYFDEVLETLKTTLIGYEPETKTLFLDHIDESEEIYHHWD